MDRLSDSIERFGDAVMSIPDVAKYLGVSEETVRSFIGRRDNPLPHFTLPTASRNPQKKVRFSRLVEWMEGKR